MVGLWCVHCVSCSAWTCSLLS